MSDHSEAIKRHEILLTRLLRKANVKQTSSYLTKFGMHGYIPTSEEDTGTLVRDMFPVSGRIVHIHLFVETVIAGEKEKRIAELLVAIESNNLLAVTQRIMIGEGKHEATINLAVSAGDRLIVKCSRPLKGVWYALTIEPVPQLKSIAMPDVPELVETTEVPE